MRCRSPTPTLFGPAGLARSAVLLLLLLLTSSTALAQRAVDRHLLSPAYPVPSGFGAAYNIPSPAREILLKAHSPTSGIRVALGSTPAGPGTGPGCLATFTGPPLERITGNQGYNKFLRMTWQPQARFDARGATWHSYLVEDLSKAKNCFPVMLGADWGTCGLPSRGGGRNDIWEDVKNSPAPAPTLCWYGGTIIGDQPTSLTWGQVKAGHGATFSVNALEPVIEGVRIHNLEDAFVPLKSRNFTFRGNWVTYNRDDCIENDGYAAGLVEDNLFDGCFALLSAVNYTIPLSRRPVAVGGGPNSAVTFRNNLIRMGAELTGGSNPVWKVYDDMAPKIKLRNNIFYFSGGEKSKDVDQSRIIECSNNTIVWGGSGNFPGKYPSNCFKVTKDKSVWDNAVAKWKADHPDVARIPGVDD